MVKGEPEQIINIHIIIKKPATIDGWFVDLFKFILSSAKNSEKSKGSVIGIILKSKPNQPLVRNINFFGGADDMVAKCIHGLIVNYSIKASILTKYVQQKTAMKAEKSITHFMTQLHR